MQRKPITILGINPGSKYSGISIFYGSELIDWRVKVISGKWSKEKMEKAMEIIASFIDQYQPDVLSIKRLNLSRSSRNLNNLVAKIITLAKAKKLKVYEYSIKELEAFFSPMEKINKKQMMEIIASEYPALFHDFNREKSHKNPYHSRMFEAVALGSVCFSQLDKN